MKALVTGGAGFIGSHLVDELLKRNFKVVVIDDLSTGKIENLRHVKKKIKFIKCDLYKSKKLYKLIGNVNYVFHLAGLSKVSESIKNPQKYYKANFLGTLNLLNSVSKKKLRKIIFSASASCYGNPKEIPTSEKAKIETLSPYALTKWMSEKIILERAKIYNFQAISLRLFNIYGPRSTAMNAYSSVISIFLKQKLSKKPLTIVGNGLQSRSFVHVSDVVNAMLKAANSKVKNDIFNVGNKKSTKIIELAKLFQGKKIYIPKRIGDPIHSNSNINKIKKYLKWKPKISIQKGIENLVKNYR